MKSGGPEVAVHTWSFKSHYEMESVNLVDVIVPDSQFQLGCHNTCYIDSISYNYPLIL